MSHGDSVVRGAATGFAVTAASRARARRGVRGPRPAAGRRAVPPRGRRTRRTASRCSTASCTTSPASPPTGPPRRSSTSRSRPIRAQVGDGRAICGLSGGVDSAVAAALVQRAIGDRLTCVFVDHGLLRAGEREQVERDFVAATGARLDTVDAARPVPRRAGGRHRPRDQAQDHRPGVHPGLRGGRRREVAARRHGDVGVPRPGHALPGRRRVRRRLRHRHDQEPPQRRRPAGRPRVRAGRAAADAVQGRGAQGRRRSSACPRRSSAASRSPGPGLGIRIIGEVTARPARDAARRRRHRPRGADRRRAWTARSGSARWCCSPTSAASACRATAAPTATRSCCARCQSRTR